MQIGDILNLLQKPKRQSDGSFLAYCPAHADKKTLSLHVSQKEDRILLKCFAGCTPQSICESLKIEMSDLFVEEKQPEKRIVATYDYTDEQGNILYQKVRYEPKDFRQRHQVNGEWVWSLNGIRRVLYRLPEVLKAETVYLVEGEKDVDNLRKQGVIATTAGSAQDWRPEMAESLAGKKIIIIPDNDTAGFACAKTEVKALKDRAKEITCIMLDGHKDISDWLADNHTLAELHEEDIKILEGDYLKFTNKGSRYLIEWENFQCEISKIKNARDTTICQMVIFPKVGVAFRTRLNLESDRARSSTAKELSSRYKGTDWKAILEDIANRTLAEFEKGEPVVEIQTGDEVPELEYLIYPIIPLGKQTVLFGDPGSGKSQIAVVISLLTIFNTYANKLRLTPYKKGMRGLVLDWEADEEDWRRQLKWFTDVFGLGWANMYYRRCSLSLAHELDAIKEHIETVKADYVIIDSVSLAAGGDLNHMDVATGYFRALRQLNITAVSLAHTSKNREDKKKTILGSVLFEAGARNVWEVRGQEDAEKNTLDIALFHQKSNLAKKHPPLGYRINYIVDPNNPKQTIPKSMIWHEPSEVPEFAERMDNKKRILLTLRDGPLDNKEIAELTGIDVDIIRVTANRLKSDKKVVKIGDKWGLVTAEFDTNS